MEIIPVDLDNLLPETSEEHFDSFGLQRYALDPSFVGQYRIVFDDDSYEDIAADNASHAFQLCARKDIKKIENLLSVHKHIIDGAVMHSSGTLTLENDLDTLPEKEFIVELEENTEMVEFELLDFDAVAQLQKTL